MADEPQINSEPMPPFPPQRQTSPGLETELRPRPSYLAPRYKAAGKLEGKIALVTGGDSGIGRAVAVLYAREGADVAITYLAQEQVDADETRQAVEAQGRRCLQLEGDLSTEEFCQRAVEETVRAFGGLDILVSNAAYQRRKGSIQDVTRDEWEKTFRTNIDPYFLLVKFAVPHMKPGASIIATSSETSHKGSDTLLDYSATKGAIDSLTRSLAQSLIGRGIRVNAVAPGPVWTPLNPADEGLTAENVSQFGADMPIKRPAQPEEIAPVYVFLASDADSSYVSGAIIPETGGLPIM